jgi:membrane-associated protease RseP (regulator of RpoE activity)
MLAVAPSASATKPDIAAYQALAKQDLRLATVGHRLASANAPFCQRKNRNPGWVLHDKAQYPDAETAQAAFGFRAPVAVSAVILGGTAETLGVKSGDAIIAINGAAISDPPEVRQKRTGFRLEQMQDKIGKALDTSGVATIAFLTVSGRKTVVLSPPAICASRFWVDTKSGLDAGADGVSVRVTEELMAFVADDDHIA